MGKSFEDVVIANGTCESATASLEHLWCSVREAAGANSDPAQKTELGLCGLT